ncbi:MAG: murein L,D-transpeptidase catalytic domain family protein [Gemmatimonadaceae bacterium]|nr:murein L,D-transpeptidase catalytic domain family protein [Gemmatimonadaceae bacterium]
MTVRFGLLSLCLVVSAAVLLSAASGSAASVSTLSASDGAVSTTAHTADPDVVYDDAGLSGIIAREVFEAAYESVAAHGLELTHGTLAIADMSQPSTAQRLVLVDLKSRELLLRTWVAHGSGSGGLMAERFSNRNGSHATSLGLYRVGSQIVSPKHGAALLLHGLDKGLNDLARPREVIIHGADYVSKKFIARTGRLGRSWGCPAVPRAQMTRVIAALEGDGLLYVYGS